ncbi:MAG: hypothetical protein U0N04_11010, partial [Oscillospiraceae bacterium]
SIASSRDRSEHQYYSIFFLCVHNGKNRRPRQNGRIPFRFPGKRESSTSIFPFFLSKTETDVSVLKASSDKLKPAASKS